MIHCTVVHICSWEILCGLLINYLLPLRITIFCRVEFGMHKVNSIVRSLTNL